MYTKHIFIALVTAAITVSCKKELMPQDSTPTPKDSSNVAATDAPKTPGVANSEQQMPMPPSPPTSPATTAPGMNPPHGQPGHRCDLAVGAPLNSQPAPSAPGQGKMTVTPAGAKLNPPPPIATAPGMNPPHGQPGHRCDIAVGQPLNSAPNTPSAATITPEAPPAILSAPTEPATVGQ